MPSASAGDLVQLISQRDRKIFHLRLAAGARLETHRGIVEHDALIGLPFGHSIVSHLGELFFLLHPSTADLVRTLRRSSQIIYPKDLGYILMKLSLEPGQRVIEAGTGSGGMTLALARAVGHHGRVYSYDLREDMQNLARRNLATVGLQERVTFHLRDIAEGFDEAEVAALFFDVPNPWDYLAQAHAALTGGGHFGALVPTANQVSDLLTGMRGHSFAFPEVVETLLRRYKTVPQRLRPEERMVGHTGYLVFGRPVSIPAAGRSGGGEAVATEQHTTGANSGVAAAA